MTTPTAARDLKPGMKVSIAPPRSFNRVLARVRCVEVSPYSARVWVWFDHGQASWFRRDFPASRTVDVLAE